MSFSTDTPEHAERAFGAARRMIHVQIEPSALPHSGLSSVNKIVCLLIILASVVAVIETEPLVVSGRESLFFRMEIAFAGIFLFEYIVRVWVAIEDARYTHPLRGRLRYMFSFWALLDLIAIAPVLLAMSGPDALLLRIFRLLRILRLARLGRFSSALDHLVHAVVLRRYELGMSIFFALLLLVFSSALLYVFEGNGQPESFGSIPRAMWWSAITLTTVGYGDVYPVSAAGRIFAALTAIAGIGLIAMPTGILASAFSDVIRNSRSADAGDRSDGS